MKASTNLFLALSLGAISSLGFAADNSCLTAASTIRTERLAASQAAYVSYSDFCDNMNQMHAAERCYVRAVAELQQNVAATNAAYATEVSACNEF